MPLRFDRRVYPPTANTSHLHLSYNIFFVLFSAFYTYKCVCIHMIVCLFDTSFLPLSQRKPAPFSLFSPTSYCQHPSSRHPHRQKDTHSSHKEYVSFLFRLQKYTLSVMILLKNTLRVSFIRARSLPDRRARRQCLRIPVWLQRCRFLFAWRWSFLPYGRG